MPLLLLPPICIHELPHPKAPTLRPILPSPNPLSLALILPVAVPHTLLLVAPLTLQAEPLVLAWAVGYILVDVAAV
jgi:hypothetical protein